MDANFRRLAKSQKSLFGYKQWHLEKLQSRYSQSNSALFISVRFSIHTKSSLRNNCFSHLKGQKQLFQPDHYFQRVIISKLDFNFHPTCLAIVVCCGILPKLFLLDRLKVLLYRFSDSNQLLCQKLFDHNEQKQFSNSNSMETMEPFAIMYIHS